METKQAYNHWAEQYDTNINKTRDLEAIALRTMLQTLSFQHCLEIGCGTAKNTVYLMQHAQVTAVDFSEEMLAKAREKIIVPDKVQFVQADIHQPWHFAPPVYDLVTFSLVLEHTENLDAIFEKVSAALLPGGHVYIGELHPFKQYSGSKARFETEEGTQVVPCFTHHTSDFTNAAEKYGLQLMGLQEFFDDNNRNGIPRILSLLLKKQL